MNDNIIESIGHWGTVTTPYQERICQVRAGDIIEIPESLRKYPTTHRFSRIASINQDGIASVCEDMGNAYLQKDGSCEISGGPFWGIPTILLKPTKSLYEATYWNWGNNSPGKGKGIYYRIPRPLHLLTVHPDDLKYGYGVTENEARERWFSALPLREKEWSFFFKGEVIYCDNTLLYVFRKVDTEKEGA